MNIPEKYFTDPTLFDEFESKYSDQTGWYYISRYQKLSEEFIEKFQDKIDWDYISGYPKLSEEFIERFQDNVNWEHISRYQKLSESFIEKFQDKVDWYYISINQKLSEEFIERFQDKINWNHISMYQKLSENFIERFQYNVDWYYISINQKLSEEFIEKFQDKVDWYYVSKYQKLSEEFIEKFKDKINVEIQLKTFKEKSFEECKSEMIEYAKKHNLKFENDYLYAYRNHDKNNRGYFNKTISYDIVGKRYEDWHCDMNPNVENSFGLGIWPTGNTKVKIHVSDWGCAINGENNKARVKAFIIDETHVL